MISKWIDDKANVLILAKELNNKFFPEIDHKIDLYCEEAWDSNGIVSVKVTKNKPETLYILKVLPEGVGYITLFINSGNGISFYEGMKYICHHARKLEIDEIYFKGLSSNSYTEKLYSKFAKITNKTKNSSNEDCFLYKMNSNVF